MTTSVFTHPPSFSKKKGKIEMVGYFAFYDIGTVIKPMKCKSSCGTLRV